ncbi:MAG: NfeD family protein [Marinilabiliales bacterium]
MRLRYLLLIILVFLTFNIYSSDKKDTTTVKTVFLFDIKQEIGPAIWRQTQKAFDLAKEKNAYCILIHMNTYGGLLDAADSIRTKILYTKIPVIVFIDNNAASAGALIAIACDKIYMRPGANIGAATVVDQTGQPVPDKYQSFMRSMMRSTAESHGKDTIINGNDTIIHWHRNPEIAEAMVDPAIYIENIIDSGKVLTFTTTEAIANNYCDGTAENIQELLDKEGISNYNIYKYEPDFLEEVIGFLINPVFQGILIMLIFAGIYFELQSPGIGFPLGIAVLSIILYFAPLYLEGLAENWEILIFIIGLILIILEIFVIPGFGVAGISGIILVVSGLTLAMVDNIVFEFNSPTIAINKMMKAVMITVISMVISFIFSLYISKKVFTAKKWKFALNDTQDIDKGYIGVDLKQKSMKGKYGTAITILRPSGKIEIDNEQYDAIALTSYIEKGETVVVVKDEAGQLYVEKTNKA